MCQVLCSAKQLACNSPLEQGRSQCGSLGVGKLLVRRARRGLCSVRKKRRRQNEESIARDFGFGGDALCGGGATGGAGGGESGVEHGAKHSRQVIEGHNCGGGRNARGQVRLPPHASADKLWTSGGAHDQFQLFSVFENFGHGGFRRRQTGRNGSEGQARKPTESFVRLLHASAGEGG